ncbi:hypothetical protein ACWGE0_11890 [Lentzea sp. NPDC054927]
MLPGWLIEAGGSHTDSGPSPAARRGRGTCERLRRRASGCELVSAFLPDLLRSNRVPDPAKEKILGELAQYAPHDDVDVLLPVGVFALTRQRSLPSDQIGRIATTVGDANLTLKLLLVAAPPVPEVVSVLKRLGEPYGHFASTSVSDFKVPADEAH